MICKSTQTNEEYNYSFVENGCVLLENQYHTFSIPYENWVNEYYVVSKLYNLKWWNNIFRSKEKTIKRINNLKFVFYINIIHKYIKCVNER